MNIQFTPFPHLATNRLVLRKLMDDDAPAIYQLRSDDSVNQYLGRKKAESLNDAKEFIQKINTMIEKNDGIYWAIILKQENKLVGTICLFSFDNKKSKVEIGYELLPAFQGKGLMQEAISEVIRYANTVIGVQTIEAFTHKQNQGSLSILEKNKFQHDPKAEKEMDDMPKEFSIYSLSILNS